MQLVHLAIEIPPSLWSLLLSQTARPVIPQGANVSLLCEYSMDEITWGQSLGGGAEGAYCIPENKTLKANYRKLETTLLNFFPL